MANSTGTPQGALYQIRGQHTAPSDGNGTRNRSAEQEHSYNSGNPMNYNQFLNGQDPALGRYKPPTLAGTSPTDQRWNNDVGGYAYNLPTSFGGFGGFSQYSKPPEGGWSGLPTGGGFGGGPQNIFQNAASMGAMAKPAQAQQPPGGRFNRPASNNSQPYSQYTPGSRDYNTMPSVPGQRALPPSSAQYKPQNRPFMQDSAASPPGGSIELPPIDTQSNPSYNQIMELLLGGGM